MSIILKIPNSTGISFPPTNKAAKSLYLLTCHLDHLQQWQWQQHQGWTQGTISTLALRLTLIKATLCHSWRCTRLCKWHDCPLTPSPVSAQDLLHIIYIQTVFSYTVRPYSSPETAVDCQAFNLEAASENALLQLLLPPRPMKKHSLFLHNFHRFLHKSQRVLHKETKIKKLHENRTCF